MNKIKLFLAVPTTGTIADSQVGIIRDLEKKYADKIEFIYPNQVVRRFFHDFARNAMVEDFLDSGADVMWFLDSDVTPPLHILDLITEHWDKWKVSGAIYPIFMVPPGEKEPQIMFTAYRKNDSGRLTASMLVPYSGVEEIDGLATGCLFIKREVFTELLPERPVFAFSYDPNTRAMVEGEDFYFARRCVEKGIKFFTDYSMVCKHNKNMDLLEMNNYAISFANRMVEIAIANYDKRIREQLVAKMKAAPKKSSIITQW